MKCQQSLPVRSFLYLVFGMLCLVARAYGPVPVTTSITAYTPGSIWASSSAQPLTIGYSFSSNPMPSGGNIIGLLYNSSGTVIASKSVNINATLTLTVPANTIGSGFYVTVLYSGSADGTYSYPNCSSTTATFTIGKLTPTITWAAPSDIPYGTALSGTQLNATANAPGTFVYSPASGTVLGVGYQTLSVTFTPTDTTSYTTATRSVSLIVTKATASISLGNLMPVYDGSAKSPSVTTVPAGLRVLFAYTDIQHTGPSGAPAIDYPTAAGPYGVTATISENNYQGSATGTLVIDRATPTITWNPAAITYGTALSGAQLNASASVAGTYSYSPAGGAMLGAGNQTLSVTFTPNDSANYRTVTTTVGLNVAKADQTGVTLSGSTSVLVGGSLNFNTGGGSGTGGWVWGGSSGASGATVNFATLGTYTVTLYRTGDANYNQSNTASVTVTVNRIPTTFALNATNFTYSGSAQGPTVVATPSGATFTTSGTLSATNAGGYAAAVTATGNYTSSDTSLPWTISKADQAAVTLTGSTSVAAGGSITFTQSGGSGTGAWIWGGNSGATGPTVSFPNAGTYTVTVCKASEGNYNQSNIPYIIVTVSKATASISLSNLLPVYDGSAKYATATTTPAGLMVNIAYTDIQHTGASGPPAIASPTASGPYGVTATISENNYQGSATGTLYIDRATPTITWPTPAAITFGTALSGAQLNASANVAGTFSYSPASGTVLGASPQAQTLSVTFTPNPTDSANYKSATKTVPLYVSKATPTISWPTPAAITYGTPLSTTQLNADAGVAGTYTYSFPIGAMLGASLQPQTLTVTFMPTDTTDYNSTTSSVNLTVNKAPLKITANDASRAYGAANPSFTASYTGFVNNDTPALVKGLTFTTTDTATSAAGTTFPITPSGASAANYNISYVNGTLTVTQAVVPTSITIDPVMVPTFSPLAQNLAVSARVAGSPTPSAGSVAFTLKNAGGATIATTTAALSAGIASGNIQIPANTQAGAGYTITATYTGISLGDYAWADSSAVGSAFNINQLSQTITFANPGVHFLGDSAILLSGTASSGLGVTFSVASGPATISGNMLTITGVGAVTIIASQAGNANYAAAPDVSQSFTVYDPNADNNHNGIPNRWELEHGLDPNDPNDALADPDGDGLTNIAEYNLGTDPQVPDNPARASLPTAYNTLAAGDASKTTAVGITAGQFAVDKNGAATYTIPIAVSPGTAGMAPKLSLNYSSQAGNGIAGFGWSLSGVSVVTRGPQTIAVDGKVQGVGLSSDDRFYLDGQRLIAINSGVYGAVGTEYRTEIESFSRIVSYGSAGSGPQWFKVWTKAGLIIELGNTADSRRQASGPSEMISWSVSKISDTAGNYMTFTYDTDATAGTMTLSRIDYTGNDSASLKTYASVRFAYEDRSDKMFGYAVGTRTAQNKRLKTIKAYYGETVVKTYTLNYIERSTGRSILDNFVETGMDGKSYPPLTFTYDESPVGWEPLGITAWAPPLRLGPDTGTGFVDVNGDGRPDLVCYYMDETTGTSTRVTYLNTPNGWVLADGSNGQIDYRLPDSTPLEVFSYQTHQSQDAGTRLVDLDGDGLVDIVRDFVETDEVGNKGRVQRAYRNTGSGWVYAPQWCVPSPIADTSVQYTGARFVDFDGDGLVDFICGDGIGTGWSIYKNTGNGWQRAGNIPYGGSLGCAYPAARFMDINGDGRPDLVYNAYSEASGFPLSVRGIYLNKDINDSSNGWGSPDSSIVSQLPVIDDFYLPYQTLTPGISFNTQGVEAIDLNGDGLPDFIWKGKSRVDPSVTTGVRINTGAGFASALDSDPTNGDADAKNFLSPIYLGVQDGKPAGVAFIDVNGDGLPDLVYNSVSKNSSGIETRTAGTYLNTGHGWQYADSAYNLPYALATDMKAPNGTYDADCEFVDLDGDGVLDMVYNRGDWEKAAYRNTAHSADRLICATTGLGLRVQVSYAPLTKPNSDNPKLYTKGTNLDDLPTTLTDAERAKIANVIYPLYVVSSVDHDDGSFVGKDNTPSTYTIRYQYGELRSHRERGSLGFGWMNTVDTRTNITSTTTYRQDFPFTGMVSDMVTETSDGATPLSESHSDYAEGGTPWTGTHFVYSNQNAEKSWDLNGKYLSGTSTSSTYDSYGNALTIDTQGLNEDKSLGDYRKATTNTYDDKVDLPSSSGTSRWYLGRLKTASVTSYGPDLGSDIPKQITRSSSFDYFSTTTGFLKSETVEPGKPNSSGDPDNLTLTTTYDYDTFGNKKTITLSGGEMDDRTTSSIYDDNGRFPISTTNALNQTENYEYNQFFGTIKSLTGPNQLTTTWDYDGMGRKNFESRPCSDSSTPNTTVINYRWCDNKKAPSGAVYQIETVAAGTTPSIALYDCSGRAIYSFGINGGLVDGSPRVAGARTWFDNFGRAWCSSLPFYYTGGEPSPVIAAETTYDLLNRPMTIKTADDPSSGTTPVYQTSSIAYNGRETSTTNPKAQVTRSLKNSQGWVVETFSNDTGTGSEHGHVKFAYDPLGQLRTTTVYSDDDAASVATTLSYDLRGRKTGMVDPDMGSWSYHYDAAGDLLTQTDAKAQTVTITYDALGRVLTRSELEGTTTWTYDTAAHGIGKLASVVVAVKDKTKEKDYSEDYAFDELGRPSGVTRTIGDADDPAQQVYSQGQTYDAYSRPLLTVYPGGFQVGNRYNALGFLTQVYDARASSNVGQGDTPAGYVYWWANGYALNGAVNASTLGNGVTLDRVYSDITGRLGAIASGRGSSTDVQNIVYTYDSLGNATRRVDSTIARDEAFQYDGLNRLKYSDVNSASAINVTYDALGNIKSKTNAGTLYKYGENNCGPHAVTTVVSDGPLGTRSFTYDANGNLAWDGQRSITWTSYNQVKSITKSGRTTKFWFGAGHERIMQQDTGGATTTYVGSLLEIVQTGSLTEKKHYIYTPAGRVAVRTTRTDGSNGTTYQTRFLHQDALGSVTTVTDELGAVEQRFTFDAWGLRTQAINTRVDANGQPKSANLTGGVVTRGFTDHEHLDDFGLIHMNGRVYDPLLGRFLSADPFVQSPGDSQSYNRYSYCMNNPVNGTDPSGYFSFKDAIVVVVAIIVTAVVTVATRNPETGFQTWTAFMGALHNAGACVIAGGAAGGFASGFTGSLLNGGNLGDAFRAGAVGSIWGSASAACAYGVGQFFDDAGKTGFADWSGRALAHGTVDGALSEAQGAGFRHGFYAGAFSSASSGWLQGNYCEKVAESAVIGGTASALGGGKFENGAMTGAFTYMFNAAMEKRSIESFRGKGFAIIDSSQRSTGRAMGGGDSEILANDYAAGIADAARNSDGSGGLYAAAELIPKGTKVLWLFSHGTMEGVPNYNNRAISSDDAFWTIVSQRLAPDAVIIMTGCQLAGEDFRIANLKIIATKTHATIYASEDNVGAKRDKETQQLVRPGHLTNEDETSNALFVPIKP